MKIDCHDGLLFVSMTLEYGANTLIVDNIILDTGAAQSLIAREAVEPWCWPRLFQVPEPSRARTALPRHAGEKRRDVFHRAGSMHSSGALQFPGDE